MTRGGYNVMHLTRWKCQDICARRGDRKFYVTATEGGYFDGRENAR